MTEHDETEIAQQLRLDGLPDPDTRYWTAGRKARVVEAVASGLLTKPDACARYAMAPAELNVWIARYRAHGVEGLRQARASSSSSRGSSPNFARNCLMPSGTRREPVV